MAQKLTESELKALRASIASGKRNAISQAQLERYREAASKNWVPVTGYKMYDLIAPDGTSFGKVSYEAYKAATNGTLSDYETISEKEKKVITEFRNHLSFPLVLQDGKEFEKVSYDAYMAAVNGKLDSYTPKDSEKATIDAVKKYIADQQKNQEKIEFENQPAVKAIKDKYGLNVHNITFDDMQTWAKEHDFSFYPRQDNSSGNELIPKKAGPLGWLGIGKNLPSEEEMKDATTILALYELSINKRQNSNSSNAAGAFEAGSLAFVNAISFGLGDAAVKKGDENMKKQLEAAGINAQYYKPESIRLDRVSGEHPVASTVGTLTGLGIGAYAGAGLLQGTGAASAISSGARTYKNVLTASKTLGATQGTIRAAKLARALPTIMTMATPAVLTYNRQKFKATNSVASGAKDTPVEWLEKQIAAGNAQYSKQLASTFDLIMPTDVLGKYDLFSKVNDYYGDALVSTSTEALQSSAKLGKGWETAGEYVQVLTAALPNSVTALFLSGAGASGQAIQFSKNKTINAAANYLSHTYKNPQYWTSMLQTLGTDYEEAKKRGASDSVATAYAVVVSSINAGIELGGYQALPDKVMGDLAESTAKKTFAKGFCDWLTSSLEEGGEEVLQSLVSNSVAKIFDHETAWVSETDENAVINLSRMAKEFGMGAFAGMALSGGQIAAINAIDRANVSRVGEYMQDFKDEVIATGLKSPQDSESYKLAKKLSEKNGEVSDYELGKLHIENTKLAQPTSAVSTLPATEATTATAPKATTATAPEATLAIGDTFQDTKYGGTITVTERTDTHTTVEINTAKGTERKVLTNEQASKLLTSAQYEHAGSAVVAMYNTLTSGAITSKQAEAIVDNSTLRAMFEYLTGTKLTGTQAEKRKQIREWVSNKANADALQLKKAGLTSAHAQVASLLENPVSGNIRNIARSAELRAAFEDLTGVKLTGDMDAMRTAIKENASLALENFDSAMSSSDISRLNGTATKAKLAPAETTDAVEGNDASDAFKADADGKTRFVQMDIDYSNKTMRKGTFNVLGEGFNLLTVEGYICGEYGIYKKPSTNQNTVTLLPSGFDVLQCKTLTEAKKAAKYFATNLPSVDITFAYSEAKGHHVALSSDAFNAYKDVLRQAIETKAYDTKAVETTEPVEAIETVEPVAPVAETVDNTLDNTLDNAVEPVAEESSESEAVEPVEAVADEATDGTAEPTKKYSLSSMGASFFGREDISADEFHAMLEDGSYKDYKGYQDYVDACANVYAQSRGLKEVTDADLAEIEDTIEGIIRVAIAAKKAGYDIYDDGKARNIKDSKKRLLFSSLEPNSDYITSSDISSICDKRINFSEIYEDIVRLEESRGVPADQRFFSNVDNYFILHKLMADKGLTAPCEECYVESMRKNLAPMANAFITLITEENPKNKSNPQLYNEKGEIKKNNSKVRDKVRKLCAEADSLIKLEDLTVEMLTTADGLAQLKIQAPLLYETFNSFYGQSKPKMPRAATPFRPGELIALLTKSNGSIDTKLVERIKSTGGFRLQSYSDFQIKNYVDVLQTIFEASMLGLNGHAYTKVPAFIEATKGTNLKRNISIFMYDDGGKWVLDKKNSFPMELEDIYALVASDDSGNTSIIAVSQNAEMSAWIMANDLVGYGIPFHKSGLKMDVVRARVVKTADGREVLGYANQKDHTKQQSEVYKRDLGEKKKANGKVKNPINIYEFWDFENKEGLSKKELIEKNIKRYIDECNKRVYRPKFREYLMDNEAVLENVLRYAKEMGFVPETATVEDISFKYDEYTIPYGYYKFVGDFGMFKPDGSAAPIEPLSMKDYDFDKAIDFFSNSEKLHTNELLQQFDSGTILEQFDNKTAREHYRKMIENGELTAEQLESILRERRSEIVRKVVEDRHYSIADGSDFNLDDYSVDDILKWTPEQFMEAYKALGIDDFTADSDLELSDSDVEELYGGEMSIEDISEELGVEPEKIEILIRREGLGASHVEAENMAVMTSKRIDRAIADSGAKFHPDYATKYITRISPTDFIDLTVSQRNIDRDDFDTRVEGDSGSTMGDYNYENALRDSEMSPYLRINRETGRIVGHNGRHRLRALEMAGINSVEIEIQFEDGDGRTIKYGAETIPDMAISSQFDTAIETHISNIIPLNEAHRSEIEKQYGEKAHAGAKATYSLSETTVESEDTTNERREDLLSEDSGRGRNESTREQTERVSRFERENKGRSRKERQSFAQELVEQGHTEEVIDGTDKYQLIRPEAYNDDMQSMVDEAARHGIELGFFVGSARVAFDTKEEFEVEGIAIGKTKILLQYDGIKSPQKLYKHEHVHNKWNTPEMQAVKDEILGGLSEADKKKILSQERYKRYRAVHKSNTDAILQEFVADTLAGMNNYTPQVIETVADYWYGNETVDSYKVSEYTDSIDAGGSSLGFPFAIKRVKMKVFPPFNESQSEANELATRWAHKDSVKSGTEKLISYHNRWYVIAKFDSMDLGYQIVGRARTADVNRCINEVDGFENNIIRAREEFRAGIGGSAETRQRNTDRGRSADDDANQHDGEIRGVEGVAEEQNGRRSAPSDSGRTAERDVSNQPDVASSDEDIRYRGRDSEGNALTEAQQEFFKDSKVRDENGNLLKVYHGTKDKFTIFEQGHENQYDSGYLGSGFYFVDKQGTAEDYAGWKKGGGKGNIMGTYLNLKNPLIIEDFDKPHLIAVQEALGIHLTDFGNYLQAPDKRISDAITAEAKKQGYDGIIRYSKFYDETTYVAYDSNQVKDTGNINPTSHPDINYSLADDGVPDLFEAWEEAKEEYGVIPKGEKPARDIDVPRKISKDKVVSQFARTMLEAGVTPEENVSDFEKAIMNGEMTHEVITNKKAGEHARNRIEQVGFEEALKQWEVLSDSGKVGKNELALGMELYNQCITNKDVPRAMKLAAELAAEATRAGQTLQACRMLKLMTPDGQLYYLEKSIQKINEEFRDKLGDKYKDIKIDEKLMEDFLKETDETKRNELYDQICQSIADQIPATHLDKWNAWRYLSMLGNPRTHIRNLAGNAIFVPAMRIKNYVGAALETAFRVKPEERTRSFRKSKEAIEFAKEDFLEMQKTLQGENAKYAVTSDIEGKRTIFNTKWLEKARQKNFDFLEAEDMWFLKMHYVDALARLITVRNIDVNNITPDKLNTIRRFAVNEAQAATYRDANALADGLNKLQRRWSRVDNKFLRGSSVLLEGVMPFKKTPLNIAKQGINYSPIGLLKGTYKALKNVKSELYRPSDAIDDIAKGLTGTGMMLLGYWLASMGLLDGDDEETDKAKAFGEMLGEQPYSLKLGDAISYTIDWATPSNLSLFIGEKLYEYSKDEFSVGDVVDALSTVSEPLLELSVFSGISGTIESAQYSKSNPLVAVLSDVSISYLTQALPTIGGQLSRMIDKNKREYYYVDKNSGVPHGLQRLIGKVATKIPGASYLFEPSIDVWGREETYGEFMERTLENTVSPGYYAEANYTAVDKELQELYDRTGDAAVLPTEQAKYYKENKEYWHLTAEEYTEAKRIRGQKSFELISDLLADKKTIKLKDSETGKIRTKKYSQMSDEEKVKAAKRCYEEAGDYTKEQMLKKKEEQKSK